MLTVRGTNITMNRCDSVYITVTVRKNDGTEMELGEGDTLYFAAKRKATDKDYAIAPKPLLNENGHGVLELCPEDTEQLEFGTYIYDVQLVTAGGTVSTVIKPSQLVIEESITGIGDRKWKKKK